MKIRSAVCFFIGLASVYGNPCLNLTGLWHSNQRDSNISVIHYEQFPTMFSGSYSEKWMGDGKSKLTGIVSPLEDGGSLVAFNSIFNYEDTVIAWVGQCMVCDGEETIFTTWLERSKLTAFEEKSVQTRVNRETYRKIAPQDTQEWHEPSYAEPSTEADLRGAWISTRGDRLSITDLTLHNTISGNYLTDENPIPLYGLIDTNTTFIVLGFASAEPTSIKGWTSHVYYPRRQHNVLETSWLNHTFVNSCTNPRAEVKFGQDNYSPYYPDME